MNSDESATFDNVIEIIESLPEEQRNRSLRLLKAYNRERRNRLAQSIKEAKEEYMRGEVGQGTVDDLMRELSK